MHHPVLDPNALPTGTREFYRQAVDLLNDAEVPFLVGGAYALAAYTGVTRHTKDFDVFLRPSDCCLALDAFAAAGFRAELTFPHWLGKVYSPDGDYVDLIFSSGNGVAEVDDEWFSHAVAGEALGKSVLLCPAEEMIWSKAFVMERERFDGADIAHLLRARAPDMDWERLKRRFGPNWRLLLTYLILFGYIYPGERALTPRTLMDELLAKLKREGIAADPAADGICQGTMISREQYLIDIENWGYQDARLWPRGKMTSQDVATWTASIEDKC